MSKPIKSWTEVHATGESRSHKGCKSGQGGTNVTPNERARTNRRRAKDRLKWADEQARIVGDLAYRALADIEARHG